jgi:hypothetical protein
MRVLAPTPKHLAEQVVRVKPVGEVDDDPDQWSGVVVAMLVDAEHGRQARWEVVKSRMKEALDKLTRTPPA